MNITCVAYEKYKTDWLVRQEYDMADLVNEVVNYIGEMETRPKDPLVLWEQESGFAGTLYAGYEEFLENEFKDEDYMRQLLTVDEFIEWMEYWHERA